MRGFTLHVRLRQRACEQVAMLPTASASPFHAAVRVIKEQRLLIAAKKVAALEIRELYHPQAETARNLTAACMTLRMPENVPRSPTLLQTRKAPAQLAGADDLIFEGMSF